MAVPENAIHYLEFVTPDAEAVCKLYEDSHGWQFEPMEPALGNAFVARIPGGSICGVRAPMSADEKPVERTYVRVTNIDAAVNRAAKSGAKILLERMEIPGHGIIAIYLLGEIEHGIWQVPLE